ncbi:serine protease [Polymorphobacter glacialis]|uniref:Probable periplasmic serine endoprotease DegP-like n=1 Tax=Sandarakinorhabdus glacialis TaxID=1614636 RepID=A0A916ZWY3_9SPHN|nr:Do family serine endopeptidase [Polymorphobacter glacialis]GGE16500.1 serine protease [Polymorphobacter glacialis]
MRIVRSLLSAAALLGGAAAVLAPAFAQTTAPVVAGQPAQNATPPAAPIAPPGGAPRSFADLTSRLSPAVVNVSTTQKVEVGKLRGGAPSSPLEELFRRFQEQQGDAGEPVTREATSLGSGFIIDPAGYIVTNNHVISAGEGAGKDAVDTITVTLSDRREYKAKVIGRDALTDMALLKIEGTNLPFVKFGNSKDVRVGDWAIAIGNPFGLGGTVTAGIVSALHRNIGSGQYDRYIQTDASINQGNSGGPLFDLDGNVIGINTAIFSPTGGNVGLGFSIPAELAFPVIQQLRATGTVKRGYLGVGIQPLTTDIAAGLGLPKDRGEIVASIEASGPAARAGIKQGDVIVKINNADVTYDNTLSYVVANTPIGANVPIELIRDGQRRTINAVIAQRPAESIVQARAGLKSEGDEATDTKAPGAESAKQSLGITLQPLTAELRQQLRITDAVKGVVIAGITPGSDAATNGLQRGDIILQINQRPTVTPAEAAAAVDLARKAGRDTVLLLVQRGALPPRYVGIKLNTDKK